MTPAHVLDVFLRRWNAHDVDAIVALYAADAEMFDPTLEQPLRGAGAVRGYYSSMWQAVADARLESAGSEASARGVAWLWRFSGSTDGRRWSAVGATYFALEQGLIVADHGIWDPTTIA